MKRSIVIEGIDKELELGKVVSIDTKYEVITIERMPNGKWRLVYSKNIIDDISKVSGFKILRED